MSRLGFGRSLAGTLAAFTLIASAGVGIAPAAASGATSAGHATATDKKARTEPLRAAMPGGNTVQSEVRERAPRKDGYRHIDTPRLLRQLKAIGANSYVYYIWNSPTDWDDLVKEFAPAAQKAGIKVLVYTVPPTECAAFDTEGKLRPRHLRGRCSMPFGMDYVAWARELSRLSLKYPTIYAWAIDDFQFNQGKFTPEYMTQIRSTQESINPKLEFYSQIYLDMLYNDTYLDKYGKYVDGLIYAYLGIGITSTDASFVEANIDWILRKLQPRGLDLQMLFYVGRSPDVLEPDEDYVGELLDRVEPYLEDGRVRGVMGYGTPLNPRPGLTADYMAQDGNGWLHLFSQYGYDSGVPINVGATQTALVDQTAPRRSISFWHWDEFGTGSTGGVYKKELVVENEVVWSSDVNDDGEGTWKRVEVDLTETLRGESRANITFRLQLPGGRTTYTAGIGIDSVQGTAISIRDGGFEQASGDWQLTSGDPLYLHKRIERFALDRPERVANAMARRWGGNGVDYPTSHPPVLDLGNRAMYGNGRLRFDVPKGAETVAGSCASATQQVAVDPRYERYELSFWWYDRKDISGAQDWSGKRFVEVVIDGKAVWRHDATAHYWWWQNGVGTQGPVDVTDFVKGKEQVDLSFRVCEETPAPGFTNDIGFDTIETVGLDVANPGFETADGWTLKSAAAAPRASIEIATAG